MTSPRPRRWRRRLLWLLGLLLLGRVALWLLLPWLLQLGAAAAGLQAKSRQVSLSLSGLSLQLEGLELRDANAPDQTPLLRLHDLQVEASMAALLRGSLQLTKVTVTGCHLQLRTDDTGTLQLPAAWSSTTAPAAPAAADPAPAADAPPTSWAAPLRLDALRLHDLTLRFDETAQPGGAVREITLDLDADQLGYPDQPGRLQLRSTSPGQLDALRANATLQTKEHQLAAAWQLRLANLDLASLPLPADLRQLLAGGRRLDLQCDGQFDVQRNADSGQLAAATSQLQLAASLDQRPILAFEAGFGPLQTTASTTVLPLALALQLPDLLDSLRLTDSSITLAAGQHALQATLRGEGLRLAPLRQQLAAAGLQLPDDGLQFAIQLSARHQQPAAGEQQLDLRLADVSLGQGESLLRLRELRADGLRWQQGLQLERLQIDGPDLTLRRAADGSLAVAGLRLAAPPPTAAPPAAASPPAPSSPPGSSTAATGPSPELLLRAFQWNGGRLRWIDDALPVPATLDCDQWSLVGSNLGYGSKPPDGRLELQLQLPASSDRLRATLQLQAGPQATQASLQLAGEALTLQALSPWLQPLGLQPEWQAAELAVAVMANVQPLPDGLELGFALQQLRLRDGQQTLLSLQQTSPGQIRFEPGSIRISDLQLDGPQLSCDRDAEGRLAVAGLRLLPGTSTGNTSGNTATKSPPTPGTPPSTPIDLRTGTLQLANARLDFAAPAAVPERRASVLLAASLAPHAADGQPSAVTIELQLAEAIRSLQLTGDLSRTRDSLSLRTTLRGTGLGGPGFAALLPPGLAVPLADGSLRGELELRHQSAADRDSLLLQLREFELRDGDREWAALELLEADLAAIGADLVHVRNLRAAGLRALLQQGSEGLELPGLRLASNPPASNPAPNSNPAAENPAPTAERLRPSAATPLPRLQLDALELACERLTFRDLREPDATPLQLSSRIALVQPWTTAADLSSSEPLRLRCDLSAAPLCGAATAEFTLQAFAMQPWLDASFALDNLQPAAIGDVLPALRGQLGASGGRLAASAHLHAELDLRRRDPQQFAFDRPFGGHLVLDHLLVQDLDANTPVVSLQSLDLTARSIDPASGDLLLREVELSGLALDLEQRPTGLAVAGFLLAPATAAPPGDAPPPPQTAALRPPTLAIDRLRLQGLRLGYRDLTSSPPTLLPLEELDFELADFSTEALREARSFEIDLTARGGDVPLDRRVRRSSVLAGVVGSATSALLGGADRHRQEARPLFQDLRLQGTLQLHPLPRGQVEIDLAGFELPALRGLANHGSVSLHDGLFDLRARADLRGGEGSQLRAGLVFTSLSIAEPPNGPISTYLRLPAPLDTVLFLLRNDADEQRLPLQVQLPAQGLAMRTLAEAAVEALALAIGNAIARSPFRLASTVTGLFDFSNSAGSHQPQVAFAPCAAGSTVPDLAPLAGLLKQFAADPELQLQLVHELGSADLERCTALANPAPATVAAAIARLRHERSLLLAARQDLAATTAARHAAAHHEAFDLQTQLLALDTRLGELEHTLDAALDQLDDQSPRARQRRTRQAAERLANQRLDELSASLLRQLPAGSSDRIERRRPRGQVAADLEAGGRIVVTLRRRSQGNPNLDRDELPGSRAPSDEAIQALRQGGPAMPASPLERTGR